MTEDSTSSKVAMLLKGIDRYNPENLELLEAYVMEQATNPDLYDLDANIAVLKLYQFNPTRFNADIAVTILLKCLTQLPSTYFHLGLCLISAENQGERIHQATELSNMLEMCNFKGVWEKLNGDCAEFVSCMTGFDSAVRRFVLYTVKITYQRLELTHLQEWLDLDADQTTKMVVEQGWRIETGDDVVSPMVCVPINEDNQCRPKKIEQNITFDHLLPFITSAVAMS